MAEITETKKIEEKKPATTTATETKDEENKTLKRERSDDEASDKEDEENNNKKTKVQEEKSTEEKPKFVFGSKTSFGSGFKMASQKKDDSTSGETKSENAAKPFAFGSGFSFGSGFGVLNSEPTKDADAVPEDKEQDKKDEKEEETTANKSSSADSNEVVTESGEKVHMFKQDVKSGEELENTVFQANAKLYQLVDIKTGWKERGVGVVKINTDKESEKTRIIMRTRTVLKVILNMPLVKGVALHKGFPGSLQSEKFIRIIGIDENNKPVTYALKTGKEETSELLYKHINDIVTKL